MIMKKVLVFTFCFLLFGDFVWAQGSSVRQQTRKGNREYKAKRYDKAEVNYRRAISEDSTAYRAQHNLGNALYRTKNYPEAIRHYDMALREPSLSPNTRSDMLHNRGNCHLRQGLQKERAEAVDDFKQAVADYQDALKLNPKNDDTRYNLSYAMKMLQQAQQQQQQQGGGDQNNQDKKDQQDKQDQQNKQDQNNQQDKQDQQNNQNNKNQQQQDQQNQQNQQDKQQKKQQQQQQQKKQDAERLLEAVKNNEKNTLKEQAKKVEVGSPRRIEKDW